MTDNTMTLEQVRDWLRDVSDQTLINHRYAMADAITRHLSQPAERGEAVAWMVPSIVSFNGVMRTNCPPEMQAQIEGTVAWHPELIGDSHPVTDRDGVTHKPRPLVYGYTAPPAAAGVPKRMAKPMLGPDQDACDGFVHECGCADGWNACRAAMLSATPSPEANHD